MLCIATDPCATCPDCGASCCWISTREADTLCRNCGLVVESHMMSDAAEFRVFCAGGDDAEQCRTGAPSSRPGEEPAPLGRIGDARLDRLQRSTLPASQRRGPMDLPLFKRACAVLGLPDDLVYHAQGIVGIMQPRMSGLRFQAQTLQAICVFCACKDMTGCYRTPPQVCQAFGTDPSNFMRLYNAFGARATGQRWFSKAKQDRATDLLPLVLPLLGDFDGRQRMQIINAVKAMLEVDAIRVALGYKDAGGALAALMWVGCAPMLRGVTKRALTDVCGVRHTTVDGNIKIIQRALQKRATKVAE